MTAKGDGAGRSRRAISSRRYEAGLPTAIGFGAGAPSSAGQPLGSVATSALPLTLNPALAGDPARRSAPVRATMISPPRLLISFDRRG